LLKRQPFVNLRGKGLILKGGEQSKVTRGEEKESKKNLLNNVPANKRKPGKSRYVTPPEKGRKEKGLW